MIRKIRAHLDTAQIRIGEQTICEDGFYKSFLLDIPGKARQEIFVQVSGYSLRNFQEEADLDWALLAALFPIMSSADSCHIHGMVSPSLLASLSEFNEAWRMWKPHKYRKVELSALDPREACRAVRPDHYVFAFSGGVDAAASLVRHASLPLQWRQKKPGLCVFVHGFDIPLEDNEAFAAAEYNARAICDSLGLKLCTVKTNMRAMIRNWEDAFASCISSILHLFKSDFVGGVLAAGESYVHPVLPWGSNPITDPLLRGSFFDISTDGWELRRSEKIALLAGHPAILGKIRVCWEKPTGWNCGKCEKCIRTQLGILIKGGGNLSAFDHRVEKGDISKISIRNELQLNHLRDLYALASGSRSNAQEWWLKELRTLLFKHRIRQLVRKVLLLGDYTSRGIRYRSAQAMRRLTTIGRSGGRTK